MNPPKAFISYSWDSTEHQQWVAALAERLRHNGVDAILDRWTVAPGDQLTKFMETSIRDSDFVVMICTPKYREKSNGRFGGVGYEGSVITGEVVTGTSQRKFIPILRHTSWPEAAPSWMTGNYYVNLTNFPASDDGFHELLDTIHGMRESAPPIGQPPARRAVQRIRDFLSPNKSTASNPATTQRATGLIREVQAGNTSLASCMADALTFAIEQGDRELREFCNRELTGYREFTASDKVKTTNDPNVLAKIERRMIQYYIAIGTQVNIDYFGSGTAAIAYMQQNPDHFRPFKMAEPKPVADLERDAAGTNAKALLAITMPASMILPKHSANLMLYCYARGDALRDLLGRIRARLTEKLMKHVSPKG